MEPFLSVKNLDFSYHSPKGETCAIKDLSFSIKKGDFTSIVGPSGCGKSTLLSILSGLESGYKGTIAFHNPNHRIGYMLQKDHLLEWRTTYENLLLGLEIQKKKVTKEIEEKIDSMLISYGLYDFKYSKPSQLSGGMRQRAALIRTLLLEPDLLLLDEPFSALDYQTRLSVADDIYSMIQRENKTTLLITHDISEAISMSDRILVLSHLPATLKKDITINLTTDGERTPMLSRGAPEFRDYFNEIWKELISNEISNETINKVSDEKSGSI